MQCARCQHENPPGSNFCLGCGARLGLPCASCGNELPPGSRFCNKCGRAVTAGADSGRPFVSPESYTPKHLAERILTSKAALEGERKQVTVLFADLKGSMELLADRDPEEARKLLDPVLERMMEAVHRYEGTVNQVMGDGIMALFGAPLAHEDHAVRACYAALRMQESVKQYAEAVRRAEGVLVQIRVGLNSGEVVVRSIGSDLHMDYTAVGQTTHLAGRMEQMAAPGSILLTADVLRLVEGYVGVRPLGPMSVKGLDAPTEIYEVTGAGPVRTRLQAGVARGLTRFVGRDREVEQLRQALERAVTGHGQVVAIVGEPGVGKSRLVWEVTHSHRSSSWLILQASSVSYGQATPYLPVIDLLKTYFQIEERDDQRRMREKVMGKLLALDRSLEPSLSVFLALLDVPVEDGLWAALDPPQRRQRTLEAIKRLLLREAQVQPLLLVFEDLHWIDSETQALLDNLIESFPAARVLLLVNYRPEYQHGWGSRTFYTQLRLDPLPPEGAEALLHALLGDEATLHPLSPLLIERTEGNPFFLEESVRMLVETRALVGERGAYRLVTALPSVQVPTTVQAILAARIDRLPGDEKRLLHTASVIGTEAALPLLQAVADLPEEVLRRGLAHLQAAEFLYETRLFPDVEYTFKHALTHGVAYGGLLQERRRALHARIVEAIESLYAGRLAEHVGRLAYHASRGEVWEKAVDYLRQAGTRAFAASANREAITCFDHALEALAHLPETRETSEQGIDLRFDLRNALHLLGEYERVTERIREAERLARTLNDSRRLGWVAVYMSLDHFQMDDPIQQKVFAERALAIAESPRDVRLQVAANCLLGAAYLDSGEYRRADAVCRTVMASLDDDLARDRCGLHTFPAVFSRVHGMRALAECGAFEQGIGYGKEAFSIAESLGHSFSLIQAFRHMGYLYGLRGEFGRAADLLERGLVLVGQEGDLPLRRSQFTGVLGNVYATLGRVTEGLTLLLQDLQTRDAVGTEGRGFYYSHFLVNLGQVYMLANRPDDARASAERALTVARERGGRGDEVHALHLLGEIAAHGDSLDAETAEAHYRQALAHATELGMRPLVAHCHLGLGTLYRRTGDRQRAREHLAAATTMYREMGMTFWLEKAEAASPAGES